MKPFLTTLTLAIALSLTGLSADAAPWERPRPSGMTAEHERYAQAATDFLQRNNRSYFGRDPLNDTTWGWSRGIQRTEPVSNMDQSQLDALFLGRYFIYNFEGDGDRWTAAYYDPNGTTHYCMPGSGNNTVESVYTRYTDINRFGMQGYFYRPEGVARTSEDIFATPVIANPENGQVAEWIMHNNRFTRGIGWIQSEYPGGFAQMCPNMPRVSQVNEGQTGLTMQEIARGARAVRGFDVSFPNNPANPLTAEMLYWAHPPS